MQEVVEEARALGMGCVRKEVKREVDRKRRGVQIWEVLLMSV